MQNVHFWFQSMAQKRRLLKLSNNNGHHHLLHHFNIECDQVVKAKLKSNVVFQVRQTCDVARPLVKPK